MKITRRDLDSTIIEKLDLLDNVIATYDPNNPDGFISYGKNGFYFKRTNDTFLRKIFNEDEIVSLEEELERTRKNVKHTNNLDMRSDKTKFNIACKSFLHDTGFSVKKILSEKIILVKVLQYNIFVLTDDGVLHIIKDDSDNTIPLIDILHSTFNIGLELGVHDILDIDEIDETNIVIATEDFGVYKMNILTKAIELVTLFNGVRELCVDKTGNLFIASRENCARYDITNGKKIETYKNLAKYMQIPRKVINTPNSIFVLGDSCGVSNVDNLLHCWKLDKENIGYNLYDKHIPKNKIDSGYQILYTYFNMDTLFLSGTYKNEIFVWEYSLKDYRMTETKITCLNDNIQMDGFIALDLNRFLILSGNICYLVKNDKIIEKLNLPEKCYGIYLHKNELITVTDFKVLKIVLPVFESKAENIAFDILDMPAACNNIDIFVKGAGRPERISIIDAETNTEIAPSYYAIFNENTVIKLLNCPSKKIKLIVSVTDKSSLGGIVIKNNKMFLR